MMFTHPEMIMDLANERHRELIAEADRYRLINSARENRHSRRDRKNQKEVSDPAGTLAECETVPAR